MSMITMESESALAYVLLSTISVEQNVCA